MPIRLAQVMTAFPSAIGVGDSLIAARKMMDALDVRHLPVVSGHTLVGVISDRDIRLRWTPEENEPDSPKLTVKDVCIDDPYSVDIETPLTEVVRAMAARHIGAAIITKSGRLAGIFTATDACRTLADLLDDHEPPDLVA